MQRYQNFYQVIAIWAINNFTTYRILNVRIGVSFDSYRHHITNNFQQLIEIKQGLKITSIITTSILITIGMHIRPTGFLKVRAPEVVFDISKKIPERLVIVEEICAKLIFSRCVDLDLCDYCKFKAAHTAKHENNIIEVEEENLKAKAK